MPDGSWSEGASSLIERVKQAVMAREITVAGSSEAFAGALQGQAVKTDMVEAQLSGLQAWVRGVQKICD